MNGPWMKFGVIGGGAWGTALAQTLASEGAPVRLWAREDDVVASINATRENSTFLKGLTLSRSLVATGDLAALSDCEALLVVTPAQHMRNVLAGLKAAGRPLILCCKGMEAKTRMLMSDVAAEVHADSPIAVLSGPTFAHEVAAGLPAAVTLASEDAGLGRRLAEGIAKPNFRPYLSTDVIGAEIGGAVKNVLAIACGVVEGADLGQNARAALISRGFAEMTRFGTALGARSETLAGLAGLGDLVLTCSSTSSRNFSLGKALGEGHAAKDLMADRTTVAEGAHSAPVVRAAAREHGVDMPIVDAVNALLDGSHDLRSVINTLLTRPLKSEH